MMDSTLLLISFYQQHALLLVTRLQIDPRRSMYHYYVSISNICIT